MTFLFTHPFEARSLLENNLLESWIAGSKGELFFFPFIFIGWRLITLQYCSAFCHTLTWISHGFTCIPCPDPLSHLPLYPLVFPLGLPSAPAPEHLSQKGRHVFKSTQTNLSMKQKQTHRLRERLVVAEGEDGWGKGWSRSSRSAGANYYTQNGRTRSFCIAQGTIVNIMINHNRNYEKECIHMYIWVTLLYRRNSHIVNQLYFNKFF